MRFNYLLRFTPRLSLFSPEETHDIILCVEFSWMLFKVSLKAFFRAKTRASLDFVELNKTVWITFFEAKSPKKSLKRPFKALGKGETDDVFPIFPTGGIKPGPWGFLVPHPAASCPQTGYPDTVSVCMWLDFELKKGQNPLGIF